jgi:hypothetical protein
MIPVRQSTAFECSIGPVLDADGVAFTGAIVGDFQIKKTSGDWAALNGSATATHTAVGNYDLVLTASDLDTVGVAAIRINDTVNACATIYLQVIEEAVYDALYAASAPGYVANAPVSVAQWAGTNVATPTVAGVPEVDVTYLLGTAWLAPGTAGTPDVNVKLISDDAAAADALEAVFDSQITGTSDSGTTTSMVDAARTEADTDYWAGSWIMFTSGTISGQTRLITGFTPGTDTITFAPATTQAVSTNTYEIIPAARVIGIQTIDEDTTTLDLDATIRAAVGLGSANLDTQLADLPTVAEFEARTLVAANYFDPAADTVANVTTVGSVTTKTGYALTSDYDFAKGTVAVTEAYAADGAAPTPVQALMLIQQALTEVSISGTTMTIKKIDGSATATTLTLNDASTPTSKTRAT